MDITLDWTNHVGQQIYATSVVRQMLRYAQITEFLLDLPFAFVLARVAYFLPVCSDGTRQVIVPSFFRDLTVLDSDGHALPGA